MHKKEPDFTYFWYTTQFNDAPSDEEESDDESEPPSDEFQLNHLIFYMRSTHFYCTWCAIKFNDAADLADNCPGDSRDAHDD